ncbi:MAG: hypothetical protein DRN18_01515 [Thermoplasmata archaeon]|nr:MAG: hypothetical protein DRN18_01515 [Thermoplasmata archaeon]
MKSLDIAGILVKKPKTVLLVYTIITFLIAFNAKNLYMESDLGKFLPEDEPTIKLLKYIGEEWNIGDTLIIYVESDDVLDLETLKDIDYVTNKINPYRHDRGELDGIVSETSITSLIKLKNSLPPPAGEGKYELPSSESKIMKYVARIGEARKTVLTDDYKASAVVFTLSSDADEKEILKRAEDAVAGVDTKMYLVGTLPLRDSLREWNLRSMAIIFPLAIFFVSIVLFAFHRSFKGLIITFLPTAYSIFMTFGILGIVRPQLTMLSIAIVALLLGLGVDYSIHLMNRFLEERGDHIKKARKSIATTGKAVLLSTITTAIGFGSLMISSMAPLRDFGFGCSLGIVLCFFSTLIMVPPLIVVLDFREKVEVPAWKRLAKFATKNSSRIVFLGVAIAIFSLAVFPKVGTDVNYFSMAPKDNPVVLKTKEFSERFGSSGSLNLIMVEGDLKDPKVIKEIYNMEERMRSDFRIHNAGVTFVSIADIIKKINLEDLPDDSIRLQLIYSLMEDKIETAIDEDFSKTLISVNIPIGLSMEQQKEVVTAINSIIYNTSIPGGKVYPITGATPINVAINDLLFEQQTRSLFLSILLVFATLILIFRSSLHAFLTIIPVIFVLLLEPGILVSLGISLSVVTISIASIIVGTGVDYGVHITKRYLEGVEEGLGKEEAMEKAIEGTGLSLLEAALTTVAGLLAVYFVNVPSLQEFTKVVISMIILSLLGAVFFMPALYRLKKI